MIISMLLLVVALLLLVDEVATRKFFEIILAKRSLRSLKSALFWSVY